MPCYDIDGGLVWNYYRPAVFGGVKALPKETYVSVPFRFGGSNINQKPYSHPNYSARRATIRMARK